MNFDLDAMVDAVAIHNDGLPDPELVCLFGEPGSGKTTAAASLIELPDVKNLLFFDTEGSAMSVSDPRITVVPVHKLVPKSGGKPLKHGKFQFMQQMLYGTDDKPGYLRPGVLAESKFDAIVIDTFGELHEWAVSYFQDTEADGFKAWDAVWRWHRDTIKGLKVADGPAVITVHGREEKLPSGAIVSKLDFSGGAKNKSAATPDIVSRLVRRIDDNGDPVTVWEFVGDGNSPVKSRYEKYGIVGAIEGCSLAWIYEEIRAGREAEQAARKAEENTNE